jgi:organic hydroperoxide reductase OsmC/OhrA
MSDHRANVSWQSSGGDFVAGRYSREHTWSFDGGVKVPASASPSVVPAPHSNPAHVDPEEAFVAAIASCHLLTFLHLASREGFEVLRYDDEAVGQMTKNERRVSWVSSVVLHPRIAYAGGKRPSAEQELALHERAHEQCFIANSVRTEITVSPCSEATRKAGADS